MKTIRFRFIIVVLLVGAFVVTTAGVLNYMKYKETIGGILHARTHVVAQDLDQAMQRALSVGVDFDNFDHLQPAINRARSTDVLVNSIDIFDETGEIRYSSDSARVHLHVNADWLNAAVDSKKDEWSAHDGENPATGTVLSNSAGLPVGYIAVQYNNAAISKSATKAGKVILVSALFAFVLIALAAPELQVLFIRDFEKNLKDLDTATERLESSADAPNINDPHFMQLLEQVKGRLQAANAEITQARQVVERVG